MLGNQRLAFVESDPSTSAGGVMENQQPNWRCRLSIMFLVTVRMLVWIIRRELGTDASR